MKAAVLTCDVVASRTIPRLPTRIASALHQFNRHNKNALFAGFVVTLGDEFQGVLREIEASYRIFLKLHNVLGLQLYAGLGVGMVESDQDNYAPHMTGQAFIRSREALTIAKKKHREFITRSGASEVDSTINSLTYASQFIRSRHKKAQAALTNALVEEPQLTVTELARKFHITKSAASQTLKTAGYEVLSEIYDALEEQLSTERTSGT